MAQPITEQIIDNLITTLRGITTDNGYEQTINQVSRFTTVAQMKFTRYPAADVVIDRIDKTDEEDHGWQSCDMFVIIGAYTDDRTDPGQALSILAADIEKALAVDETRGNTALDTAVTGIDYDYIDADLAGYTGVAVITAKITYEHERINPYTS